MGVAERLTRHADGVERLEMSNAIAGKPLYYVSVYRIGDVLIDSGCAWGRPVLQRYLREHPVAAVLTTHEHEDHVGNHEVIQADLYAPDRAVDLLRSGPPRLPAYRWLTWGGHGVAPRVRPLDEMARTTSRAFRVVRTPGHSEDHVVFLDEETTSVFSGDAFLGKLKAVRAKEDVPRQMESVRRIAELDPAALYPAHGPVLERPRTRLLEVVEHFDRLREKAFTLRGRGWSARRIRQELLGPEPALTYVSLGAFSAENVIRSLLGEPVPHPLQRTR
jgi:ribonuclease/clavin/mitogillin